MEDGEKARVYGTQEAAKEIGVAASTIRQLVRKKLAHGKKRGFGVNGEWQFTQDEVDRLKEAYGPPAAASVA